MGSSMSSHVLDPETIVVGDYLGSAWDLVQDVVWDVLHKRLRNLYLKKLRIVTGPPWSGFGADGAVALVFPIFSRVLTSAEGAAENDIDTRPVSNYTD